MCDYLCIVKCVVFALLFSAEMRGGMAPPSNGPAMCSEQAARYYAGNFGGDMVLSGTMKR